MRWTCLVQKSKTAVRNGCWISQAYFRYSFVPKTRSRSLFFRGSNYVCEKRCTHCRAGWSIFKQPVVVVELEGDPESVVRRAKLILGIVLYLKHDSKLFLLDGRIMLKKNATHIVELLMTRFSWSGSFFSRQSEPWLGALPCLRAFGKLITQGSFPSSDPPPSFDLTRPCDLYQICAL